MQVRLYVEDPLVYHGALKARWAVALMTSMEELRPLISKITLPLFIMHGADDRIVPLSASQLIHDNSTSQDKTFQVSCVHQSLWAWYVDSRGSTCISRVHQATEGDRWACSTYRRHSAVCYIYHMVADVWFIHRCSTGMFHDDKEFSFLRWQEAVDFTNTSLTDFGRFSESITGCS